METQGSRAGIRRARPEDAPVLHDLVMELATHEGSDQQVRVTAGRWGKLLNRDDVVVLLAEHGGEAVGYASLTRRLSLWEGRDILALDDLFVRPGFRSEGLGGRLMTAVATLAAGDDSTVQWGVKLGNVDGQRFYTRLGATLTTKMIATWTPEAYRPTIDPTRAPCVTTTVR